MSVDALRDVYATGVALAGGTVTARVRAGCDAAVALAADGPDQPGVVEATLHLGHLEGVWAAVFDRRHQLHADALSAVLPAWADLAADLDIPDLVAHVRIDAGLAETDDPDKARRTALIVAAVSHALTALRALIGKPGWRTLRGHVRDVIAAARAEGHTDALALAADKAGYLGFGYTAAHTAASRRFEDILGGDADGWMADLLGSVAADLGRALGRMVDDGASAGDMATAAADLLTGPDPYAVAAAVDVLVSRALARGALDLYAAAGARTVSWVGVGDSAECRTCDDLDAASPYPIDSAPTPPQHPHCRCVLVANDPLPDRLYLPYVPAEEAG